MKRIVCLAAAVATVVGMVSAMPSQRGSSAWAAGARCVGLAGQAPSERSVVVGSRRAAGAGGDISTAIALRDSSFRSYFKTQPLDSSRMMLAARQLTAMIGPFVFDEGIDGSADPSTIRK